MSDYNFDTSKVETGNYDYEPLPPGDYVAEIQGSDLKTTKAGTGKFIELVFRTSNGRLIWGRYNVENPNPKAVQIAQAQLKQICEAVGLRGFRRTEELHGKRLVIVVTVDGDRNEVRRVKPAPKQATPQIPAASNNPHGPESEPATSAADEDLGDLPF